MDEDGHVAFGVESGRRAPYELRQARYLEAARTAAGHIHRINRSEGRPAELLDIGVNDGRIRRYLDSLLDDEAEVRWTGVDLFPHGEEGVHRRSEWRLVKLDLEDGLQGLSSQQYDVVVCEQVLEHLHELEPLLNDMERVLRPGGRVIVGVPIFPLGLHHLRPWAVRMGERLFNRPPRSHVREWSLSSLLRDLERMDGLGVVDVRGFRIVSGGPLRFLEFRRWWWRLNRWLGRKVPGLCIEAQVVLSKPVGSEAVRVG